VDFFRWIISDSIKEDLGMKSNLKRTTIYLTINQYNALNMIAYDRHISISGLLMGTVQELLEDTEDTQVASVNSTIDEGSISWSEYKNQRMNTTDKQAT
jgi:hypothetical protein